MVGNAAARFYRLGALLVTQPIQSETNTAVKKTQHRIMSYTLHMRYFNETHTTNCLESSETTASRLAESSSAGSFRSLWLDSDTLSAMLLSNEASLGGNMIATCRCAEHIITQTNCSSDANCQQIPQNDAQVSVIIAQNGPLMWEQTFYTLLLCGGFSHCSDT